MNTYNVEIVHEASGVSIKFEYESDTPHEDYLASEIFSDLSVTVTKTTEDQETEMSLLKELQDINKWLDEIIWEVNKFNETIEDLSARYGQSKTNSPEAQRYSRLLGQILLQ